MTDMFADFEFNAPTDCDITQIHGMALPKDYLEFMHKHNGGEGPVGENAYLQLTALEELEQFNEDYGIFERLSGIFIFGTDLGGMLFGYKDSEGTYCAIDSCSIAPEDIFWAGKDFEGFIIALDAGEL
ncbi:MAG: SMI1/KNR4 family protein [Ruminococcus sp.]|nr:SMI1/KNR4 family protein [Ruminococcus sp.]